MATSFYTNSSIQGDINGRNPGGNGSSVFSTDRVFKSQQDLMDWVQNVGRSLGFIIVTKRSNTCNGGFTYKVNLKCEHGGVYKNKASIRRSKATKKTNCPFELVGEYCKCLDSWKLRVICEEHNHEPAVQMRGHPYAMRLSDNETRLVLDLTKKNVKPEIILMMLKKLNPNNISSLRTLYNVRKKFQHTGETMNSEEIVSPSPTECPVYAFNGNKSKGASDHIDPFALSNVLQDIDLSKYGYTDMMVTNPVKDVSAANRVKDVLMCHDINTPVADQSTSVGPFKPYRDVVLDKPQGQFSMKQFLDDDYAQDQFSNPVKRGTEKEREGVVERHTRTVLESTDREVKVNYGYVSSDVEVGKKLGTCDENVRKFAVNGTSEFSTERVFKSREELMDWVQNVGRSLGYIIVTKRTKSKVKGIVSKVVLMCDRGGISRAKTSIKTNCPFELVGKYYKFRELWRLSVKCEKHNHEPAPINMKGHPYARRLSDNETRLLVDLSRKNVKPEVILMILKKLNPDNMSTLKTIYNIRKKFQHKGEIMKGEEMVSPSTNESRLYAFDPNNSKGTSDHIDPFAISNVLQDIDLSKYGYTDNMMVTNPVKDVSAANRVREVLMCHDVNTPVADKSTSVGPFKPYRDVVLTKPQGQFSMKQFLDIDYAHDESSTVEGGIKKEREGFVEHHTNTAPESTNREDIVNFGYVYSDVEVGKKLDTGDENKRTFAVNGTSEFSTEWNQGDYHSQPLTAKGGRGSVVESQTNVAIESTDKQDKDMNVEVVNKYCGPHQFKIETIDLKDYYVDQFLDAPWLNEVNALYQRF